MKILRISITTLPLVVFWFVQSTVSLGQTPGGVSPGLVLWLKADAGTSTSTDNAFVSYWNDQSGNGNNATQGTASAQPRYKKVKLNGNPALEFMNGARYLNLNLSQIDNHTYTVYIVAKRNSGASNGYIMGVQQTSPNPGMHIGYATNTSLKFEQYGNSITQTVTGFNAATETPVIISAEFNTATGKSMKEIEEGIVLSASNSNTTSYVQGAGGTIGRGYNSSGFTGFVGEIIVYDRVLTTAEKEAVETYLAVKYGITIPVASHDYYSHAAFSYDIGGVGKDLTVSGLNQPTSMSEDADAMIEAESCSDLQNGEYLVWGNDDRLKTFSPFVGNCAITHMLERTWKFQETGEVGTLSLKFDLTGITVADPDEVVLLIDYDGDGFADETSLYGTYAAPYKTFTNLDIETGYVLGLGLGTATYYSVASGNASGAVWAKTPSGTPMVVPSFCDKVDIVIQPGHTITNDIPDLVCNDFNLQGGGTFSLGSNQLSTTGITIMFGTFSCGTGTVNFNGTTAQVISGGTLDFNHMICANPVHVLINSTQVIVHGNLTVTTGELKTAGKLTMASDASGTGMIGPLTTGNLTGNVTVQRYHNALAAGWVNMCSPIQNRTVADWNDDIITSGFPGSDYPSYGMNNVQYYNELLAGPQNTGYTGVSNISSTLQNKKGYFVYMNSGVMNLDVTGAIFKGSVSMPVTYTNTGNPSGDGWNLVGNPYACTINWDAPTGFTRTNINNAIYIWDASINQYASYVAGVGNNGGTAMIPSSQSFWVIANAASPSMTIHEDAKTFSAATFKSTQEDVQSFSLSVTNGMFSDQTTFVFNENSGNNYDQQFDAFKLAGLTPNIYMSSICEEGYDLSVNSISRNGSGHDIPVRINVPQSGIYTISHNNTDAFGNGSCVTLEDLVTGETYDLSTVNKIPVQINGTEQDVRFILHVSEPVIAEIQNVSCPGYDDGSVSVKGNGQGPWNFTWKNEADEIIRLTKESFTADQMSSLPGGRYSVTISENGACKSNTSVFTIDEPMSVETSIEVNPESCAGYSDGSAELTIYGGSGKYDLLWSNGTDSKLLNDVVSGMYFAFITDENNCTNSVSVEIPLADPLNAEFETNSNVYELKNGAVAIDFYSSEEHERSWWNFGDGSVETSELNPTHIFSKPGEYTIDHWTNARNCEVHVSKKISIIEPVITTTELSEFVSGTLTDQGVQLVFTFAQPTSLIINAYNILGQRLIDPIRGNYLNETITFSDRSYAANALIEITDVQTNQRVLIRLGS